MVIVGTQYRTSHFSEKNYGPTEPSIVSLKVKLTKPRKYKDVGGNTDNTFFTVSSNSTNQPLKLSSFQDESDVSDSESEDTLDKDTSFHLSDVDYSTEEEECLPVREDKLPNSDTKFLVFWSSLVCLFRACLSCNAPAVITRVRCQGVVITVHLLCHHNHVTKWCSTSISKGMSVGNLLISASILYSGNTFTSISVMMQICKVAFLVAHAITKYKGIFFSLLFIIFMICIEMPFYLAQ